MNDLPAGWTAVTLGDLALSMQNGVYKPASAYCDEGGVPCLRMYNIEAGAIVWRDVKRMRLTEAELEQYGLRAGDLLVNRVNSRELVGKAAVIPATLGPCVYESKNIRLRVSTDLIDPHYLNYRLLQAGSRFFTNNAQQTVGMASINQGQLGAFPVPLAPRSEQDRIVAEIEKHFTRLDAAEAALKRVQANLKWYRASVLGAAVEGRLVLSEGGGDGISAGAADVGDALLAHILATRQSEWRDQYADKRYREPAPPRSNWRVPIPPHWTVASLEQLTSASRPICYGILMPKENLPDGVPYVRVVDMRGDRIDVPGLRRTSRSIADAYARASLIGGDLLVSIRGSYGRVAVVPDELEGGNITQDTARLALSSHVDSRYLGWALRSPACQLFMRHVARGVAVKGVNIGDLRELPVPLPPLAEQRRIAEEIERRLSVVDELSASVAAGLGRSGALRRATLMAAFSGRLTEPLSAPQRSCVASTGMGA